MAATRIRVALNEDYVWPVTAWYERAVADGWESVDNGDGDTMREALDDLRETIGISRFTAAEVIDERRA